MKLTMAILEDQQAESAYLKSLLRKWGLHRQCELAIIEYCSGEDFFEHHDDTAYQQFSAFFLDIQMGEMNGLEVAKKLRTEGYREPIIFLTAFREYVFDGYQVRAMNYLLKPVDETPLFLCLDEIEKTCAAIHVLINIPYKDILSFSSGLHHVDIVTVSDYYCQYATLNSIINYLPSEFVRLHKSCIVNLAYIDKISGSTIFLSNHMTAKIGRSYMKDVIDFITDYSTRFDR